METPGGRPEIPVGKGSEIGPYRIVQEIGRGGMGVVYRAVDTTLGREVALKCPRRGALDQPDAVRRFLHEARTASKLSHPHVVPVYQVFEEGGVPWIAAELVDGCDLRAAIRQKGPLPIEDVLRHATGLAEALQSAHEHKILHRDIKPQNILIGKDGRARLTDFGLARAWVPLSEVSQAETRGESLTGQGVLVGTPGYVAPEQVLGHPADPRTDIFGLGLVLYEMCTGAPAFPAVEGGGWVEAVLGRDPRPVADANPRVPLELIRIVEKTLAKRPDERYQHAADLAADLRALLRKIESGSHSAATLPPPVRTRRRNIALVIVASSAVLIAIALRGFLGGRDGGGLRGVPRRLTSAPGTESQPALSPDGTLVAFTSDEKGDSDIWLIDARGGTPLRLTDDPAEDRSPAWFPDGRRVVFASARLGTPSVWETSRLGGAPSLLLPNAEDPAISPDGRRIAFSRADATGQSRIAVAPVDDPSKAMFLTHDDDGVYWHTAPSWSPDGSTLCYNDFRDVWRVSAEGGAARRLTTDDAVSIGCRWSSDGRYVYHSSGRQGTQALWRVAADAGDVERLTIGTGPEVEPSVSLDGSRFAYSTHEEDTDVVILDTRTGGRVRLSSVRMEDPPDIARDGSSVVFSSNREGTSDLWVQPLASGRASGPPRRLTRQPGTAGTARYSPDGRWIAYLRTRDAQRDVWAVSSDGGTPWKVTDHPAIDHHPAWSPDGRRLVFSSDRDGRDHLWVIPMADGQPAGPESRLTSGATFDVLADWSPDGRSIAYVGCTAAGCDAWVVAADGGSAPRKILGGPRVVQARWEPSGRSLLVSGSWEGGPVEIRRVQIADGSVARFEPAPSFGGGPAAGYFSSSSDGSFIAYLYSVRRGDVWVLEADPGAF